MTTFRLDGFRPWLERATRIEEDKDWSVHTIDYAAFKRNLRHFSKRRAQLRAMLTASSDDSIMESELYHILGPQPELRPNLAAQAMLLPTSKSTTTELINLDDSNAATSYVPFMDSTLFQKNASFPTAANQAPVLVTSPAVGPWNKVDVG
jgi:hypothetical protein